MNNKIYLEQYILACLINDPDKIYSHSVSSKLFDEGEHKKIYGEIINLIDKSKEVNIFELTLAKCDPDVLTSCEHKTPSYVDFEANLKRLKAESHKKNIALNFFELHHQLIDNDFETVDQINEHISTNLNIETEEEGPRDKKLKDIFIDLMMEYEDEKKRREMFYGLKSLDRVTQGIFQSELTILAARPAQGKTAVALQIALNLAKAKNKGLFVSLEMSNTRILRRLIANITKINSNKLKRFSNMNEAEIDSVVSSSSFVNSLDLIIDNKLGTIEKITNKAKFLAKKGKLDFIIIDYLQLITSNKRFGSKNEEISHYSREIKKLTLELNIPIILLSQLNRAVEQRNDKRPQLSDLRDSGAIEQDADNVFMLYQNEHMEDNNILEICITKQREGILAEVPLKYYKATNSVYGD